MLHKIISNLMWGGTVGFFGIGMGPSGGQKTQLGETSGLANFATSTGEGDISAASDFWKSILSGDPNKISKVLGPEFSALNKQGQEKKKTAAEFGNRSGGTNAGMQMTDDTTRSSADSLLSSLTSSSADKLGSLGSGLLNTGLEGHIAAFGQESTLHDENSAKLNDLFSSILKAVQTAALFKQPKA